jgi:hypothetical protein
MANSDVDLTAILITHRIRLLDAGNLETLWYDDNMLKANYIKMIAFDLDVIERFEQNHPEYKPQKDSDALMCCGYRHLKVDHQKRFSSGKVYINGLEGFWSYAKERLIKHHGVSQERFPLYLTEMEFRYNNRNTQIFHEIVKYLVNLVPDLL